MHDVSVLGGSAKLSKGVHVIYSNHIHRDPAICGGEPVVRGTRVTLRTLLATLAEGATLDEILRDFPTLTEEKVRAVIAFAADSAKDDLPSPGVPKVA